MTAPDRWHQFEHLFHAALARADGERAEFLREACSGDEGLLREIESLLEYETTAQSFMAASALESLPSKSHPSRLIPGARFGPYEIVSFLGAGGMGDVYRARDTKLDRDVAIKTLPDVFAEDSQRRARFEREGRLLASLNHPHIGAIYGFEDRDGVHGLVLELVEGQTLIDRLRDGALPIRDALTIARQIADALQAAHARDVIHRDLKPANIALSQDGAVKVLDFGLARSNLEASVAAPIGGLARASSIADSGTSVIVGTVGYMSPEQARGNPVDNRADIWAFGCVLYEILTGKRAFGNRRTTTPAASAVEHEPDFDALPATTPPAIRRVVQQCLQSDPQKRLQQIGIARREISVVLGSLEQTDSGPVPIERGPTNMWMRVAAFGGPFVAIVLAAILSVTFPRRSPAPPATELMSLAVLPFANGGANPETEYLSDGVTEYLINKLSKLPSLQVQARSTVFRYKGRENDVQAVGRALGVERVLTGQVIPRGEELIVQVAIVRVADAAQVWSEQYSGRPGDLFAMQEGIIAKVTETLGLEGAGRNHLARRHTPNTGAHHTYLRARYFWNKRTLDGITRAIAYFEQAVAQDPGYALAHAGLASSYAVLNHYDPSLRESAFPRARATAQAALGLDETLAEAHAAIAVVKYNYEWDWAGAEQAFRRALEWNPNDETVRQWYAESLLYQGRLEEGITEIERAYGLAPVSVIINNQRAAAYLWAGQTDRAIEYALNTIDLDASFAIGLYVLGMCYEQQSNYDKAIAAYRKSPARIAQAALGYAYGKGGLRREARAVLAQLQEAGYVSPYYLAKVYAGLGEKDRALAALESAYENRDARLVMLKVDSHFADLRDTPGFESIMRRIRLAP